MSRQRIVRLVLRATAAAIFVFALVADPTGVGHNKETFFRSTIYNLTGSDIVGEGLAFFINQYTLVAVGLFAASYAFTVYEYVVLGDRVLSVYETVVEVPIWTPPRYTL